MKTSEVTAYFDADVKKVWDIVTDIKQYKWRSDIDKIQNINGLSFIEYYKNGNYTTFKITEKMPYEIYAFTMENKMFSGNWTGLFSTENGKTKVIFTENILVKNPFMRFLAKFFMNVKKIQNIYIEDLKNKLKE